jgi:hypothetical protein
MGEPAVGKHGGNSQVWVKQIDAGLSHFELTLNLREGERMVPCAVPGHRGRGRRSDYRPEIKFWKTLESQWGVSPSCFWLSLGMIFAL